VVIFGVILMIVGFVAGISILWTVGLIVLLVGLVLWIMGSAGHAIGGRKHYF
jgi:fatty-acid desaturase